MRGIPLRVELGPKDIEKNQCILVKRNDGLKQIVALDETFSQVVSDLLDTIHDEMYEKALKHRENNTHTVYNYDEFKSVLENKGGYLKAMWCGDEACEVQIKEETGATTTLYCRN